MVPGDMCSQLEEPWAMFIETNGGLEPNEVIDEAVKPIGSPCMVREVMIVIPEA